MAETGTMPEPRFASFAEFFPYYLGEHSNRMNRWLHFIGTTGALSLLATAFTTGHLLLLLAAPVFGYGFAWVGHFFVEKNRPASFKYPIWSFMGDFKMYAWMLSGKV